MALYADLAQHRSLAQSFDIRLLRPLKIVEIIVAPDADERQSSELHLLRQLGDSLIACDEQINLAI